MSHRCSVCDAPIPRQAKGYKRKSLLSLIDRKSARTLFPHLQTQEAFLCFGCVRNVYKKTKKCGKKRIYVDPNPPLRPAAPARPAPSVPAEPPPPKKFKKRLKTTLNEHDYASQEPSPSPRPDPPPGRRVRRGPMAQVCAYLRRKNFTSALNRLLQVSGFTEALIRVCRKTISNERKAMVNDLDGPYRKTFSPENLSAFSWDKTTSWAEGRAPLTVACLRSMFPPPKKIQKQMVNYSPGNKARRMTVEEVKQMLDRRISLLLSVPLYTSTLRASFLQTAFSVEMLRHRCPIKLFAIMNGLGISQSKTTARIHAKKLAEEHDRQVKQWRDEIQFDGLVEAPQEFQKEHLFHEDMMKMLLSEKSESARGTLHHITSLFHFKTFNNTAKDYFLNMWDFITFVTMAYVTLFAVSDCGLDSVDQRPPDYPSQVSAQMDWLSDLAHKLVDLVWMPPSQEDINTAAAAAGRCDEEKKKKIFPFCYCREEKPGEQLLRCCSNLCPSIWFHEGCARARTLLDPHEDWFCGPDCGADGTYVYCHCKERRGGQMVQCGLMDKCRRHEWYHRDCLPAAGPSRAEQTPWFCSESCSRASDGEDFLLNYTRAVVWEGLYHMARRDAIQEGDGDAMTDFWKMDLVLLWTRRHLQLFNSSHQMITGVEGFYSERVRQDMKWNRVSNLQGTSGRNVSQDLLTELLISEFKGAIEFGKGSFTKQQVEQSAQLAGAQAKHLDRLFFTGGNPLNLSAYLSRLTSSSCTRTEDVSRFVEEFKKDELFRFRPGRKHQGFDRFSYQQRVRQPERMGSSMRGLCAELDGRRDAVL
ncbi:uncharacterized protein [Chaetodon trifascialis]|uniref:uncharacterized protein isoform X2 n=1 Tax=Chaetodon trifascialis TaxID=109706 RepID=UPI0039941C58